MTQEEYDFLKSKYYFAEPLSKFLHELEEQFCKKEFHLTEDAKKGERVLITAWGEVYPVRKP